MFVSNPFSDLIARINNAQMARLEMSSVLFSSLNMSVLNILKDEGFISDYERDQDKPHLIKVLLKYNAGSPTIKEFRRISKPGRRIYSKFNDIPVLYNGLGVVILSTSKGVLPDYEAKKLGLGGEILCSVF